MDSSFLGKTWQKVLGKTQTGSLPTEVPNAGGVYVETFRFDK